jgi:hypothetical protein
MAEAEEIGGEVLNIANGEVSVWACIQSGVPAVCFAAGEGTRPTDDMVQRLAESGFKRFSVVYDLDKSGRDGAPKVVAELRAAGLEAAALELPAYLGDGGDVDDLHRRTGDDGLAEALAELRPLTPDASESPVSASTVGFLLKDLHERPELLEPPPAIVHGFLYESRLTGLPSREKFGKTTILGWIIASLSHYVRIVWVGLEGTLGDPVRRFKLFGANPDNILLIDRLPNGHRDMFEALERFGAKVFVIDTLAKWGEGHITD